jgi:REP element-mobilizing transposase RayT
MGSDRSSSWPLGPRLMRDPLPGGRRRSIRLTTHNYSANSTYFLTLCTYGRAALFGRIDDGVVTLTNVGTIVRDLWVQTAEMRQGVVLDAFVIMPDHMHAIVAMSAAEQLESPAGSLGRAPEFLDALVAGYKASCTSEVRRLLGIPRLRLWQRNYYERVIRDTRALREIRRYIAANPARWLNSHVAAAHDPF